jgi:hypothetical protein
MSEKKRRYYIPQGDHEFLAWARQFKEAITANQDAWHLTPAKVLMVGSAFTNYETALTVVDAGHATDNQRRVKNDTKKYLTQLCRKVVNEEMRFNDSINDTGRALAGIPVPDREKTSLGKPDKTVGFTIEPKEAMQARLNFWVHETGEKAIPYGYDGPVFARKILESGEAVPTDPAELYETDRYTRTPQTLVFSEADRGKRVACAALWQNRHGKGPWSVIQVAVIP